MQSCLSRFLLWIGRRNIKKRLKVNMTTTSYEFTSLNIYHLLFICLLNIFESGSIINFHLLSILDRYFLNNLNIITHIF